MTAPQPNADRPNLPGVQGGVAYDANHPTGPVVLLKFTTGAGEFTVTIDARQAPMFMANMAEGTVKAAQNALAAAGPQLLVPQSPLLLPGPDGRPRNGRPL